jgi:branched-chain amino acid transport system substrate-binding protein
MLKLARFLRKSTEVVVIAGSLATAVLATSTLQSAAQSIKIGVVVPITSVLAPYGTPFVEAMNLAVEAANKNGGINGSKIELVVEDSQASNTVAINALNKVLQSNPVAVFSSALGTQVLALMPITEREKVPLIGSPSTRRVTQQGAKYFFRNTSHDGIEKETSTRFLVENLGKKRIGILHVANEWGYSGRDNTSNFLEKLYNLKPVSIASYQPTDKDFTAQITQMMKDGADAILVQGHPVDEALVLKQLNQLGVKVPHIGSGTLCIAFLHGLISPADIQGHYCESPDVMPPFNTRPQVQEFVKAYKDRTGFQPDTYQTHYFDAMNMLIAVMKKYGVDHESIRKGFKEMTYEGIIGTYKADEEGTLWHNAVVMEFVEGGKIKVVRQYKQ